MTTTTLTRPAPKPRTTTTAPRTGAQVRIHGVPQWGRETLDSLAQLVHNNHHTTNGANGTPGK